MSSEAQTLAPFYKGWETYQRLLRDAVAPLPEERLALRAAPELRPVWLLTAHIIAGRVAWFRGVMGEGSGALDPLMAWDDDDQQPRSAAALVQGLEASWRMIAACLNRWTPADLDATFQVDGRGTLTRQWVIWHILEHDLHHGGELALTLGMHGIAALDV